MKIAMADGRKRGLGERFATLTNHDLLGKAFALSGSKEIASKIAFLPERR